MQPECDIYKLIENFIIKSNGNSYSNEELRLLTPPQSPTAIKTAEIVNDVKIAEETKEQLNKETGNIEEVEEEEEFVNLKPNRPYSYYVATNFHPFDQLTAQVATTIQNSKINLINDLNTTLKNESTNKKKRTSSKKNRLSVSLTDIKKPNNNNHDDKLAINNNNEDKKQKFSSQNCISNQNSKLKTFELNQNKAKTNRLNRLFRRLFTFNRKIKSSSPLSSSANTPMVLLDQNDVIMQHISYNDDHTEVVDEQADTSRFVRFFTSFRSRKSSMNTNKSEAPIGSSSGVVNLNSSQNLPHISLIKGCFFIFT